MKTEILEYYPNGSMKYKFRYYPNGSKYLEFFYDENGMYHREDGLPAYQEWYESGRLHHKAFLFHGNDHNTYNLGRIWFHENGKIAEKYYHLELRWNSYTKLDWMNQIKNV